MESMSIVRGIVLAGLALMTASGAVAGSQPAVRAWQTGKWGAALSSGRGNVRAYAIETDDARYDVQETPASGAAPLKTTVGAPVSFALDKNDSDIVYIREDGMAERQLHLVKTTRKLKTYGAAGPGHFIRAIGDDGGTITLEDGSVWRVDPRTQFKTAEWEALAGITVHSTEEDPDFNYILNNSDEDDWTFVTLEKNP
jgi:hypothetical protein